MAERLRTWAVMAALVGANAGCHGGNGLVAGGDTSGGDTDTVCDPAATVQPNQGLVEEVWDANCLLGMVTVTSTLCADKYESALSEIDGAGSVLGPWSPYHNPGNARVRAVSLRDAVPQAYINEMQASAACAEAGKRLCSDVEWLRVCRGALNHVYPYGDTRDPGACNDSRAVHPAVEYFGTTDSWIWGELDNACLDQLPSSLDRSGALSTCTSDEGVLDLMGNLNEWTADPQGTFRGGSYVDTTLNGDGCLYATTAHDVSHWDFSTGFRCCADR